MKKFSKSTILYLIVVALVFTSCEKEEGFSPSEVTETNSILKENPQDIFSKSNSNNVKPSSFKNATFDAFVENNEIFYSITFDSSIDIDKYTFSLRADRTSVNGIPFYEGPCKECSPTSLTSYGRIVRESITNNSDGSTTYLLKKVLFDRFGFSVHPDADDFNFNSDTKIERVNTKITYIFSNKPGSGSTGGSFPGSPDGAINVSQELEVKIIL